MTDLPRIVAFTRRLEDEAAEELVPFRYGTAIFNSALPQLWDWNFLRVERPADADQLAAEAERLHGARNHDHRKLWVDDEELGAALEPAFRARGWTCQRLLVMVQRRPPDREPTAYVTEVAEPELRGPRGDVSRSQPWGNPEAVRQMLEAKRLKAAGGARFFAARVDGVPVSFCDLYFDGRTAQIEDVVTMPDYRGRGLASSLVLRAIAAARESGHDLVFLTADEQDWPQQLYSRLGFDTVGRFFSFLRTSS